MTAGTVRSTGQGETLVMASTFISIFPHRDAITRLVGSVLAEPTDEWLEGRRYPGLDVLRRSQLHILTTPDQEVTTPDHTTPALTA